MNAVMLRAIVLAIAFSYPGFALAYSCVDIVKQINSDITTQTTDALNNKPLLWKNLIWLKQHMTNAPTVFNESPDSTTYTWTCNAAYTLTATTNAENAIIKISGTISNENGANMFISPIIATPPTITSQPNMPQRMPSKITTIHRSKKTFHQPPMFSSKHTLLVKAIKDKHQSNIGTVAKAMTAQAEPPVLKNFSNQPAHLPAPATLTSAMSDFKTWFKADLKTDDAVMKYALVQTEKFYNKLRQCKPGNYSYPMLKPGLPLNATPIFVLANSGIMGKQKGKCVVKTSIQVNGALDKAICAFTPDVLEFFTDESAQMILQNKMINPKNIEVSHQCQAGLLSLGDVDTPLRDNFANGLAHCKPGKYQFKREGISSPNAFINITSQIVGSQHGKCVVENQLQLSARTIKTRCNYSQSSLNDLINNIKATDEPHRTQKFSPENTRVIIRIIKECN